MLVQMKFIWVRIGIVGGGCVIKLDRHYISMQLKTKKLQHISGYTHGLCLSVSVSPVAAIKPSRLGLWFWLQIVLIAS